MCVDMRVARPLRPIDLPDMQLRCRCFHDSYIELVSNNAVRRRAENARTFAASDSQPSKMVTMVARKSCATDDGFTMLRRELLSADTTVLTR
jgi:hypothetical protein